MVAASVIAIPLGLLVGHLRRGAAVLVGAVNALRSLPTLGLLTFLVLLMGLGLIPPIIALVILAIPPLLAGAYAGIANVDPPIVDAARAMGMTEPRCCSGWKCRTRSRSSWAAYATPRCR